MLQFLHHSTDILLNRWRRRKPRIARDFNRRIQDSHLRFAKNLPRSTQELQCIFLSPKVKVYGENLKHITALIVLVRAGNMPLLNVALSRRHASVVALILMLRFNIHIEESVMLVRILHEHIVENYSFENQNVSPIFI